MRTITWTTKTRLKADVTISINKHPRTMGDGWGGSMTKEAKASEWSLSYDATVAEHGDVNGLHTPITTTNLPVGFAGRIGQLCFNAEIKKQIETAVEEIENTDDWKTHIAAKKSAIKAEKEYYAHTRRMHKTMNM